MGWLGWSHHEAMHTAVYYIFLALDGKIDFLKKTTPSGDGSVSKSKKQDQVLRRTAKGSDAAGMRAIFRSFKKKGS